VVCDNVRSQRNCELAVTWVRPYISQFSSCVLLSNAVVLSYLEIKYGNRVSRNAVYLFGLHKDLPFLSVVRTSYFSISDIQCCLSREENQSLRNSILVHVAAIVCRSLFIPFFFRCNFCLTSCSCPYSKVFKGVTSEPE
jgi:hypothetical protein